MGSARGTCDAKDIDSPRGAKAMALVDEALDDPAAPSPELGLVLYTGAGFLVAGWLLLWRPPCCYDC